MLVESNHLVVVVVSVLKEATAIFFFLVKKMEIRRSCFVVYLVLSIAKRVILDSQFDEIFDRSALLHQQS